MALKTKTDFSKAIAAHIINFATTPSVSEKSMAESVATMTLSPLVRIFNIIMKIKIAEDGSMSYDETVPDVTGTPASPTSPTSHTLASTSATSLGGASLAGTASSSSTASLTNF